MSAITRRGMIGAGAMLALPHPAKAQNAELQFSGAIRIVSGFAAGGSQDVLARIVGEKLRETLGRPVIVENRAGAGGRIAAEYVLGQPPDGSAILVGNIVTMVLLPLQFKEIAYDATRDFQPLARTTDFQNVAATGSMTGAKTFAGLAEWLKRNPDKANCGVPAVGSIPHIYAETLSRLIGVKIAVVPYRGGAPIAQDLAAGQLALGSSAPADFSALHKAGQLTIVASSGTARHPSFADVPTFAELGLKGLEANGWNGFFLHGNAPAALAGLYTRVILDAVREPSARAKLVDLGFIPVDLNAEAFITALNADKELWTRLIREADIKLN